MEHLDELHDMRSDVEFLKRDVSSIQSFLGKLETAIDKISIVASDVGKLVSIHETRLQQVEGEHKESKRLSEKESDLIHARISQKEAELRREVEKNHMELMAFLKDHDDRSTNTLESVEKRVNGLEKWMWTLVGVGSAIIFVSTQLNNYLQ